MTKTQAQLHTVEARLAATEAELTKAKAEIGRLQGLLESVSQAWRFLNRNLG